MAAEGDGLSSFITSVTGKAGRLVDPMPSIFSADEKLSLSDEFARFPHVPGFDPEPTRFARMDLDENPGRRYAVAKPTT